MAENIYPPIIDNTISAFYEKDSMEVIFYFQNQNQVNTEYVLVKLELGGAPVFKGEVGQQIYKYRLTDPTIVTAKRIFYKIRIEPTDLETDSFQINSAYHVSIAAINAEATNLENLTDADHSKFSDAVAKYAISKPIFTMWGGLNADDIEAKTIVQETVNSPYNDKILTPEENQFLLSSDAYRIKGQLTFDNTSEDILENDVLLWYQIKFYDSTDKEIPVELGASSGRQYIDRYWDLEGRSFAYSFDYDFSQLRDTNISSLLMVVLIATRKGYIQNYSYPFEIVKDGKEEQGDFVSTDENIVFKSYEGKTMAATPNDYKGVITLETAIYSYDEVSRSGVVVFQRADATKRLNWETFAREPMTIEPYSNYIVYEDVSAEPGIPYYYRIQFYYEILEDVNNVNRWVTKYAANSATLDSEVALLLTEDMFLMTKDAILKIRYNPEISSYKRNIVDVISPTLGGAYPFVRRNGQQCYRTFNINGLISYHSEIEDTRDYLSVAAEDSLNRTIGETAGLAGEYLLNILDYEHPWVVTINGEQVWAEKDGDNGQETIGLYVQDYFDKINYNEFENALFINENSAALDIDPTIYPASLSRYDKERIYEKIYRRKVMDFLYGDQIMLFKSLPEGNVFVRLTNVSFTPDKKLDRNIYSFSAQAVEVLAPNADNYESYFSSVIHGMYTVSQTLILGSTFNENGKLEIKEDQIRGTTHNSDSYTLNTGLGTKKVQYKTSEGWVDTISSDYTYLDTLGRVVLVENINGVTRFKSGYFPETRVENVQNSSSEEIIITRSPIALKVYDVEYVFD